MLTVECPECGEKIDKRGYASHMHHKHGVPYDDQPEPGEFSGLSEKLGQMVSRDEMVEEIALHQEKTLRHLFFETCDEPSHQSLREGIETRTGVELPIDRPGPDPTLAQEITEPPECLIEDFREAEVALEN